MSNDSVLMTPLEVAAKVGVTVGAVYIRIKSGQMASVEKYGRILIPRRAVNTWRKERIEAATKQLAGASE